MDWFLQLKAKPNCPDSDGEFQSWMGRSPVHQRAWDHALKTWQLMGEVAPVHQHLWPADLPVMGHVPIRRRRLLRAGGVAAVLAAGLMAVLAAPSLLVWWQADYMTRTAESRIVTLEDGTIVHLGGDSAIRTDISQTGRNVTLLAGEAFFEVAHDAALPFSVDAGGVKVMVLGTVFDVQLAGGEIDSGTGAGARGRVL
ncbi:FecR domain-containing protein [Rhizobium sp. 32-5/1]|uniref:FecR family protein n=1 Tax=Rhizobium sp. 32-5/1 TaxID=3019602 RepID=UPI00240E1AD2|nr:FecR domain-containing protein [Rhizobium sp. 32-5/1]WEZ82400.1 FecR domain-containing protein [Rhizobium sp. 32-5/1]